MPMECPRSDFVRNTEVVAMALRFEFWISDNSWPQTIAQSNPQGNFVRSSARDFGRIAEALEVVRIECARAND
jgi:hypothetical protein